MHSTVNELRYVKRDNNLNTQKVYKEYYRDIIRSYGTDVTYFRKDTRFYDKDSKANLTYGEDTTAAYWVSAPMVVLMSINADSFILNKMGIEANTSSDVYVTMEEFSEQFVDIIGTPKSETMTTPVSKRIYDRKIEEVMTISNDNISFNVPISIDVPSGLTSYSANVSTSALTGISKTINDLIAFKHQYSYHRQITGVSHGTLTCSCDSFGDGLCVGNLISDITYNEYKDSHGGSQNTWSISPQVGDYFRLVDFQQFDGVDKPNYEEYEITSINNRNINSGGLNPLLGTYVWKMSVTRRDPSNEIMETSPIQEEPQTVDKLVENVWHETISNSIFNYTSKDVDKIDKKQADSVYGLY